MLVLSFARKQPGCPNGSALTPSSQLVVGTRASTTRVKANSRIHALPSPAMSTPPGWEPRPGPTRGDPARRAPRGPGGVARDDADPRRQGGRSGSAAAGGRGSGRGAGPSFTPGRAPGPRDGGPAGSPAPRGPQGRPSRNPGGNDRRGPLPDDFAGRPRLSAEERTAGRGGVVGDQIGFDGFRSGGPARWIGRMATWQAMLVLAAGGPPRCHCHPGSGPGPGGRARSPRHRGRDRCRAFYTPRPGLPSVPGTRAHALRGGHSDRQGP